MVAVHKDFKEQVPEVYDFLSHYETSSELTEEALVYMDENGADAYDTAVWWMNQHEDIWTSWVSEEVSDKVKNAIQ